MDDRAFESEFQQVLEKLGDLAPEDRERVEKFANSVRGNQQRMRKTLGDLQESLDHLRLSVKYLVFDLEATRRENQYLRRLIETQSDRPEE